MRNTITKRSDFAYLKKYGKKTKGSALTLIKANKPCTVPLVCFIASKKSVGGAVKRNRAKRRMRSLWRDNFSVVDKCGMYLLIANRNVLVFSYKQLVDDFLHCLIKANSYVLCPV